MTIHIDAPVHTAMGPRAGTITGSASTSAVEGLVRGETIVVWDGSRARLGHAAATASTTHTAFVIRHTSGFLQIALPTPLCDRLLIPATPALPARPNEEGYRQCIGVDAAQGTTTGISAADRALTARILVASHTAPSDLIRPGHLMVVAVDPGHSGRQVVPHLTLQLAESGLGGLVFADLISEQRHRDMADEREATIFAETHCLRMFFDGRTT